MEIRIWQLAYLGIAKRSVNTTDNIMSVWYLWPLIIESLRIRWLNSMGGIFATCPKCGGTVAKLKTITSAANEDRYWYGCSSCGRFFDIAVKLT